MTGHHEDREIFRVDKFIVPDARREHFLEMVEKTHEVLRRQEGFVRDVILEKDAGPGVFNIVTLVQWADDSYLRGAVEAVARRHAELGFDKTAAMAEMDVTPDLGTYRRVGP